MKLNIPQKVYDNNNKLFKGTAYDIRAYVGEPNAFFGDDAVLTPEAMEVAGALTALVAFKREDGSIVQLNVGDTVVVGYDNGPTSKQLADAFCNGLNTQGVNAYNIGISSSGQVYQAQELLKAQGHCQITRSHVEVTTNGAKFGVGIQGIHTYLLAQMNEAVKNGIEARDVSKGKTENKIDEARKIYFDKMKKIYGDYFSKRDNSKVAINVFGGTGVQYVDLFRDIFGKDVTILADDINVNDGKLLADPTRKEMLERVPNLQATLDSGKRVHSFDLDADRGSLSEGAEALTLTGKGHYLGDDLAFILAAYKLNRAVPELEKKLKSLNVSEDNIKKILEIAKTVYVDARYTSSVKTYVDNTLKGNTAFHRKGHSLWKETITSNMQKMAELAGYKTIQEFVTASNYRDIQIEASLHMFSTDTEDGIPRDDAVENIFILEKLLDELEIHNLGAYFADLPHRFITKEIRTTSVSNEAKDTITASIIEHIRRMFTGKKDCSIVEFDGQIRVDWPTGFLMYGMSNTSPKLTFMVEGSTPEERNEALAFVLALHNQEKSSAGDTLPMDTSENPFFIKDESYNMKNPDDIDFDDYRVKSFMEKFSIK